MTHSLPSFARFRMRALSLLMLLLLGASGLAQAQTISDFLPLSSPVPQPPTTTLRSATGSARQMAALAVTIRYVKEGASGTGASWSNASGDLQAMINASAAGDQVWVAGGTYKPGTARDASFSLKNGVSVLGGFSGAAGTEGSSTARTAIPSSTTLSGDIGTQGDTSDNSYHVVHNDGNNLDNSAILDGVVITGGNANAPRGNNNFFGGGVFNNASSPTILNCLFIQNNAGSGGAMNIGFGTGAGTRVVNCRFIDNTASQAGSVAVQQGSGSVFINCFFSRNQGGTVGGLATFENSTPTTLTNCTFASNSTGAVGAQSSVINLVNCLLWNNGGLFAILSYPGASFNVSYSLIEEGATTYTNGGNNQVLPSPFSSPFATANGPELSSCARAVDAGNNAANTTTTDVLGNARKLRTIDIGAAEYQGTPYIAPTLTTLSQSSTTVCAGTSVRFDFTETFGTEGGKVDFYQDNTFVRSVIVGDPNSGVTSFYSQPINQSGSYQLVLTTASGCRRLTSTYAPITVNPLPSAPGLLTQQGQAYPSGQSSVSVDVNSGPVNLVVSGCNGSINWSGPTGSSGTTSPIVVATDRVGRFVYSATCTSTQGCTSPAASATVTVQGRLTVLHRDVDNYATNNAIQPLLQLQNQGTTALPLSAITLRYYVTVEGSSALSNLSVNYAQVGNQNVRLRYVPLQPAQQGAAGYVEVSFTPGAGSLAAGANSGPIQGYFTKGDYGTLNETDDYSYNPVRDQLTATLRITAYYNGTLIAGQEPGSTTQIRAVRALTESRNGPSATQISTVLEVRNEGNVPINYSDLSARYYFTSDGSERLLVEVDEGQVRTRLVALSQAVNGANYYLEIRYNQGGQLAPGASTGAIRYRISKPQGGRFDQTNDYSYQERPQERSQNSRVVVYVGGDVVWGTPPTGANARLATSQELGTDLEVTLLGNPVRSDNVSVQIKGAGGEPLQLQLTSAQGRVITQQQIAAPQATEKHDLSLVGQGPGVFLLQVSTPTQTRTVRVLKAE